MNTTKIVLAIALTSVMVAVALAPIMLSPALAATSTTCSQGPSTGGCVGNSDTNNKNRCETTKSGQGGGGGEIKSTTC
jgi:hypothetical protein